MESRAGCHHSNTGHQLVEACMLVEMAEVKGMFKTVCSGETMLTAHVPDHDHLELQIYSLNTTMTSLTGETIEMIEVQPALGIQQRLFQLCTKTTYQAGLQRLTLLMNTHRRLESQCPLLSVP